MTVALDLVRAKSSQARARILAIVSDLTDDQLAWRPTQRAHSIGFTLWHTARANDNVQADLTGHPLEWDAGGYAARWGHPERGTGTGWDDERAAALALPRCEELFLYVRRVFDAADAATGALDDPALSRTVRSRFMGADSSIAEIVGSAIGHDNRHLGEIEYIKGLLGLRGTATV